MSFWSRKLDRSAILLIRIAIIMRQKVVKIFNLFIDEFTRLPVLTFVQRWKWEMVFEINVGFCNMPPPPPPPPSSLTCCKCLRHCTTDRLVNSAAMAPFIEHVSNLFAYSWYLSLPLSFSFSLSLPLFFPSFLPPSLSPYLLPTSLSHSLLVNHFFLIFLI